MNFKFEIGNQSDVGRVREVNEDYFGTFHGSFGELLIVCDGMGGHQGGETASRLAVDTIKNHFENLNAGFEVKQELQKALSLANSRLVETARENQLLAGMGSTAVVVLFKDDLAYTANLGDSRIYLVRDDSIKQLTTDHSLVQQMIDTKMISPEEAANHPKKNVITKSLGREGTIEPDIPEPIEILNGDKFVLCTDGLSNYVYDNELFSIVSANSVQLAAENLITLANEKGGNDNITVQIAEVKDAVELLPKKKKNLLLYFLFGMVMGMVTLALIKPDLFNFSNKKPITVDSTKSVLGDSIKVDSSLNINANDQ